MASSTPTFEHLYVEGDGPVRRLTLARPEKLNALGLRTIEEVAAAAAYLDRDEAVRAVVVGGAGRSFCSGFDLDDLTGGADRDVAADADLGRRMADAIESMRAVTVAAVQGHCVGGGVILAAACDLRVATTHTTFVIPEVELGLPLGWGGVPRLVRELGPTRARELIMTCRPFDAEEARSWGFVSRVVAPDALEHEADALAGEIAAKPRFAISMTKRQVAAAAQQLVSTAESGSDGRLLAAAQRDQESREHTARAARRHR